MRKGSLGQFSLAKEQIDRAERGVLENGDGMEDVEEEVEIET